MNQKKDYSNQNCESCSHREVCKIREDYIEHIIKIRQVVDPELHRFGISIRCNYFNSNHAPTIR